MKRRTQLFLTIIGLTTSAWAAAPAGASVAACPDAGLEYAPGKNLEGRMRQAVLCITNVERTAWDLPALTHNAQLEVGAQWHASDMARLRFYSHYAPAAAGHGVSFADRAARAGYQAVPGYSHPVLAENIHQSPTTPYKVVADFMKSTAHCQNILNDMLSELGIGVAYGLVSGTGRTTDSHPYWAQLFGTRDPATVPKWATNAGFAGCPHKQMNHPAPAAPEPPADETPKPPTGTAAIVTVNGEKRVAVTGSAPGLKTVRVTPGRERKVGNRVVWKPGKSVLVRVNPKTDTYRAVVRTPPPAKGRPVIRVSNTKANVSQRIPIRIR